MKHILLKAQIDMDTKEVHVELFENYANILESNSEEVIHTLNANIMSAIEDQLLAATTKYT